jgi:hypothetical protein
MSNLKPQLLSWLICDNVHIDPTTGKHFILGAFTHLRSRIFPLRYPRMVFFLTVVGVAEGKHKLKITMGLPMEESVTLAEREFEVQGPMQRICLINDFQNVPFAKPGQYMISIDIDGEQFFMTTFPVLGADNN